MIVSLFQVQREKITGVIIFGNKSIHRKIKSLGHSIHLMTTLFILLTQVHYLGSNNSTWYTVTQRKSDLP